MAKRRRKKIGRNEPCPCGSGLKYKKCHGRISAKHPGPMPEEIKSAIELHKANVDLFKAKEARRRGQQGQGRPIISAEFQGYRLTAVGNQIHYSKNHKTFIDFLGDYIGTILGSEWGNAEIAKPLKERHQILQWYDAICTLQRVYMKKPRGAIQTTPINGVMAAYYGLAYNLYLLQHNAELQDYLIRRLKQPVSFYAAYYETFVAAWFILAGFNLHLEDEEDSTRTHPEFIATRDNQTYSVEAKTRQPGKNHFDVGNQLYSALCIEANHPRVVFIDMNVGADADFDAFGKEALAAIQDREPKLKIDREPAPPAHVFVTNQPYHLGLSDTRIPRACLITGFKIPDFGGGTLFPSYTAAHKARLKYGPLYDVQKAIVTYSIPTTFDGEVPEFAFGEAEWSLIIGERYEFESGKMMALQSGIVVESEKKAYLVFVDDENHSHIVTAELTDAEIAAYKSHPDTFFGRLVPISRKIEDPLEFYQWVLSTYKETPREKLLEIMDSAPDIEELKKLHDNELRYAYAERLTHAFVRDQKNRQPSKPKAT